MRMTIFLVMLVIHCYVFAAENPIQSSDTRTAIKLKVAEKDFVLERMRRMLETLTAIQSSIANNSPQEVAGFVKVLLEYSKENQPTGIHQAMPEGFKLMSQQMNLHWRTLLSKSDDSKVIQTEVVSIMSTCNACHRTYRIE